MSRRRALRGLLALAVVLLGIGGGEVGLRIATPPGRTGFSSEAVFGRADPVLGWTNRASAQGRYKDPFSALEYGITLDANGCRSWRGKVPGSRVAVLGDSLAFGHGVEDAETFAARLEKPGRPVQNFGVCGYSVAQAFLRLEREALPLGPEVVLFAVIPDDLRRATEDWASNGYARPRFRLKGEALVRPAGDLPPLLPPGTEIPRSGSLLLARAGSFARRLRGDPVLASETWRLGSALVREAGRATRARGARFVLVLLAEPSDLSSESPIHGLLRGLARDEGFPLVDLVPTFQAAGGRLLIPFDGHPNAEGHRAIAEAIEAALR